MALWRIATDAPAYVAEDLGGKGAEITGGRWNAAGTPMLYTATSIALACLETIVHLDGSKSLPLNRYLVRIDAPADVWSRAITLKVKGDAHVGWDAVPAGKVSIDWGNAWCASRSSALALVPSVVVPEEFNVLVNPRHPDAARLKATKLRKWTYDPRALGR
ncbi:RES family NAD+ phosphorylase [Polaromonas sp.]|uniref:RES family NAD+ phosphorylase n=1 Tax=Polaromonas sp. TaxID=1869339 RepID=UPI0024884AC6|nr:RES family NAD+ phosphorylase [Polaromonas sp.]MDI1275372.1 RES family NAD+ phosphorylase [Polaromonas sp.]